MTKKRYKETTDSLQNNDNPATIWLMLQYQNQCRLRIDAVERLITMHKIMVDQISFLNFAIRIKIITIKLAKMKFYDRTQELEILGRTLEQSKKNSCFTVMVGRRRIGKTSLLLESVKGQKSLYLFVSRKSEPLLCEQFQKDATGVLGLQIFGTVTRFKDLFEQLLIFATKEHYTLIIDEFQEFDNVNSSIFSDIQNLWDQYKDKAKMNFIASGSIYSMMMKIFENRKDYPRRYRFHYR
jgi:hypothetical protein